MALSKVPDEKVNLITCPICSEVFKSPKTLPCLHTFCELCIHQIIVSANHKKENKTRSFSCPICRTVVKPRTDNIDQEHINQWAATLPDNISLNTMITFTKSNSKPECHACKRHEQTTEAKFWCKQCVEAFCEKCNSMHSWMKILATHQVVLIDEFVSQIDGIDLEAIEEQCRTHPHNKINVFCCDHRAMCCSLCVSLDHRKCENIQSIDEITFNSTFYDSIQEKIDNIRVATQENLQTKHQEKETLRVGVEKTEDEASKFVDHIKSKLDNLFETFKKQLHVFRDEQNTKLNVRIRLLEQLERNLKHWIKVTKKVKDNGSKTQLFMHVETIKHQIETSIKEITTINNDKTTIGVYFEKNKKVQKVEAFDQIGCFQNIKSANGIELGAVFKTCLEFGVCFINLEAITVEKNRTIHIPLSKLKCGVCYGDKYILIGGDEGKVHLIDKFKGLVVKTLSLDYKIKRICLDVTQNRLYLSCCGMVLYCTNIVGESISKPKKMILEHIHNGPIGALCSFEEAIYTVKTGAIQKFSSCQNFPPTNITECFNTNTYSEGHAGCNGMTIFNEQIYFTTTAKEVKCSTLEGHQIFSHKSDRIKMPVSVAMWQFGITAAFILNREPRGSLHALSVDGNKQVKLLGKFENVTDPWDMWVDIDEKEIYVAGGEYIDVYRVKFKSE